ncbi:MAG: hypothetical protein R3250_11220 [Melioribacteraceae bacterium]|nr:hypothetical protein [Melioribacteraceae bacterium]
MTDSTLVPEIDLDFLKYILNCIPSNTMIEFCGGEPGLVSNLEEAFNIVYSHPNVKFVQIMSNGLVRIRGYDFLEKDNVYYCEHLIEEINGKDIRLFYDSLAIVEKPRWRYVIVTTERTTKSLLKHYDYYKKLGFFREMYWYKLMNPKTESIRPFANELQQFYEKLKDENYRDAVFVLNRIRNRDNVDSSTKSRRAACGWNCPHISVDFETKELVHCGSYLEHSKKVKFNLETFRKHLHCNLFKPESYCDTCYIYKVYDPMSIAHCRKGDFYNLEVDSCERRTIYLDETGRV